MNKLFAKLQMKKIHTTWIINKDFFGVIHNYQLQYEIICGFRIISKL